jgi:hypothetical protein
MLWTFLGIRNGSLCALWGFEEQPYFILIGQIAVANLVQHLAYIVVVLVGKLKTWCCPAGNYETVYEGDGGEEEFVDLQLRSKTWLMALWQTLYFLWQGAMAWITTYHIFATAFNMESLGLWARWNTGVYAFVNSSAVSLLFQIITNPVVDAYDRMAWELPPQEHSCFQMVTHIRLTILGAIVAFPLAVVVIMLLFTHVLTTLLMYGLLVGLVLSPCLWLSFTHVGQTVVREYIEDHDGCLWFLQPPPGENKIGQHVRTTKQRNSVQKFSVQVALVVLTITTVGYATRVYAGEVASLSQYFDPVKNDFQARTWLSVAKCYETKTGKSVQKGMVFLDLLQRWA